MKFACAFALLFLLSSAAARPFVDDAGRKVEIPDKVERVYAAGPPASVSRAQAADDPRNAAGAP